MSRAAGDGALSVCGSAAAASGAPTSAATPAMINIDPDFRKFLAEVNTMLAIHVAAWMKKRGKSLRPKLNDEQRKQLEECFELMDADGSGAIDADELGAAFKLLGLDVSKVEIAAMLDEVDEDGSGEVEYPEFIEIMTSTLSKLADKKEEEGAGGNQVPFALLATAYRRKRIMEGLISGDREVMAQVTSIAEQAARRAAEEAHRHQQMLNQQLPGRQRHSNLPSSLSTPKGTQDGRANMFRSNGTSSDGSIDQHHNKHNQRSHGGSSTGSEADAAAAANAAALAAAGEARANQVAAQAGVSSGLLRALQHVKSFCSSRRSAALPSPTGNNSGSHRSSLAVRAAGGSGAGGGAAVLNGDDGAVAATDCAGAIELQAVEGVLDLEEQRQLVSLLRAKTRKRLEAMATAAAAASQLSSSGRHSRSPSLGGNLRSATNSGSGGGASVNNSTSGGGAGSTNLQEGVGGKLDALVGAKQHMTSKLMLKQLTQTVEPPKFALTSPVQRAGAGSCSSSPSPAGGCLQRGCRSACSSPAPCRPSTQWPIDTYAASSSGSHAGAQTAAHPGLPGAGIAATGVGEAVPSGLPGSTSSTAAAGSSTLRRGINFGDTQIYEFDSQAGSGSKNSNAGRVGRSSDSGGGAHALLGSIHHSHSLGSLLQDSLGHLSAPVAVAADVGTPGGRLRGPPIRSPSNTHMPSNAHANNSSSGGSSSIGPKTRSPPRSSSCSSMSSRLTASALQQVGSRCVLTGSPKLGMDQPPPPPQQQQQWLPVPQLPRVSGCIRTTPTHKHSKSSIQACASSGSISSQPMQLLPDSPPGSLMGLQRSPAAEAAATGPVR